jgi:carboxylesterase
VRVPCLPGHGSTVEEFSKTFFPDWRKAAEEEYRRLEAEHDKVLVAGFSMGGTLALALAAQFPVAAVVSLAAPLFVFRFFPPQIQDPRLVFLPLLARWKPVLPAKRPRPESRAIAPWQGYEGVACPPQILSLHRGTHAVRRLLPRVAAPLLLIHDKRDRTVFPDNAWEIARRVSSRRVRLCLTAIEENVTGRHMLTTHREVKDLIAGEILAFARSVIR